MYDFGGNITFQHLTRFKFNVINSNSASTRDELEFMYFIITFQAH